MARTKQTARRSVAVNNTRDESSDAADAKKKGEEKNQPKQGMKRSSPSSTRDNKEEAKRPTKKARLTTRSPEIISLRQEISRRVDVSVKSIFSVFMNNGEQPRYIHDYIEEATHDSRHALNVCIDKLLNDLAEHSSDGDDDYKAPPPPKIKQMPGSPMYSPITPPQINEAPGSPMYSPASPNF